MGGFAFVFGFLLVCVGVISIRTSGNDAVAISLGTALVHAGAILCGAGVIAVAVERALLKRTPPSQ